MSDNANMVALLASCQQANESYANAGSDWSPPVDGQYTGQFEGIRGFTYTGKKGETAGAVALKIGLLDGEYSGKSFEIPFFQTNPSGATTMKNLVIMLGGSPSSDKGQSFAFDAQYLADHIEGQGCNVTRETIRKSGKEFVNWKFTSVFPITGN